MHQSTQDGAENESEVYLEMRSDILMDKVSGEDMLTRFLAQLTLVRNLYGTIKVWRNK